MGGKIDGKKVVGYRQKIVSNPNQAQKRSPKSGSK